MKTRSIDAYLTWAGTVFAIVLLGSFNYMLNPIASGWATSILVILCFVLLIAVICSIYARLRFPASEKPDYEHWDKVTTFKLSQAASLWAEEEPTNRTGEMSWRARRCFRKLREAITDRKLSLKVSIDEAVNIAAYEHLNLTGDRENPTNENRNVTRDEIKRYAISINKKPKFLFCSERP